MRLSLILLPVNPEVESIVTVCLNAAGGGRSVLHWRAVFKPLPETQVREVAAHRSDPTRRWWAHHREGRRGRSEP